MKHFISLASAKQLDDTNSQNLAVEISHSSHKLFCAGNTKGRSITVPLTSCLTGFESAL
jgi:hypothetical protein